MSAKRKKPSRRKPPARKPKTAARKAAAPPPGYGKSAKTWAAAADASQPVADRVATLRRRSTSLCDDDAQFKGTLKILRDTGAPVPVRLAALDSLQAATFQVAKLRGTGRRTSPRCAPSRPTPTTR